MSNTIDLSELKEIVNVYRAACSEIAKWEKVKDDLNKTLKAVMGESEIGTVAGVPALKLTKVPTSRFDSRLFCEEFPELAEKYIIPGTIRRLTVIKDATSD